MYSPSLIYWIIVQDFDSVHGDLIWQALLQVEMLGHLGGGRTRAHMFCGPSFEGPACLSCVCAAAFFAVSQGEEWR